MMAESRETPGCICPSPPQSGPERKYNRPQGGEVAGRRSIAHSHVGGEVAVRWHHIKNLLEVMIV